MQARHLRRVSAFVIVGTLLLATTSGASTVRAASGPPTRLTGHLLRGLATYTRLGDATASQALALTIVFKPRAAGAIDQAVTNLRSTSVARPLTADDVAQQVGQPQTSIDQVADFFRASGFTVTSVAPDHLSMRVTGTVQQAAQALQVQFGTYRDRRGHTFRATSNEPSVPSSIAGTIQAIFGLDTYPALHRHYQQAAPVPGSYTPSDLRTAYNVNPLLSDNINGTGQTIGVIGCDTFAQSDLNGFDQAYGLPLNTPTVIPVDGGADGASAETTLDLEWSHAIAPNAGQKFFGFPGCDFGSFLDAITQAANDPATSIISISLGACEATYVSSNFLSAMESTFASAALQGKGVFVASGDQGAYTCDGVTSDGIGVSYPASSAYVTAIGGTHLTLNADSSYGSESAWGGNCTDDTGATVPCGTGGGVSQSIAEPSWQAQAAVAIQPTGSFRGVPDVALDADPDTGYEIYWTSPADGCTGLCSGFGGTSVATPEWAGIAALANQYAGRPLGQLAPLLYGASVQKPPTGLVILRDVTTGSDGLSPYNYYNATSGWDFTTGWGSANACHVVQTLVTATPADRVIAAITSSASFRVLLPIVYNTASTC